MRCRTCKEEKPEDQFRLTEKNMVNFRCKACWFIYDRKKYEEQKERKGSAVIQLTSSYFCRYCQQSKPSLEFRIGEIRWRGEANRRCKSCLSAYESRTRAATNARDPEMYAHRKLVRRQYHEKNKERFAPLKKQHYQDNIKLYDFWRSKSAAKRRGATMFMTLEQWEVLRQQKNCHWCQIELSPPITHVDHLTPLIEGGQHTIENVVLACANCNLGREWKRKVTEWKLKNFEEEQQELPKE